MLSLEGRVVIVTGASRGIGAAVCRDAAALGAAVVGVARSGDALAAVLASCPTPTRMVVGELWALVNNAGVGAPGYRPVTETPTSEWESVMAVNLFAASAIASAVGAALVAGGRGGRIVNVSSIAAMAGLPNIAPYNATKAAMDAMSRTMAVELGPAGICCNSVNPGTIATELVDELLAANPPLRDKFVNKTALGRVGVTDEAAWPIVFLLTDAAAFITGQTLVIDGGRMASA
jgi:NAD(P)-dependent dehydrogenase (short-subunit alcohol dehydrogenase family)